MKSNGDVVVGRDVLSGSSVSTSDPLERVEPPATATESEREMPGRSRVAEWTAAAVIVLAPLLVFHQILFGGYTLSQAPLGIHEDKVVDGLPFITVSDPCASAMQDEPWLVHIRRSLANGEVPLVNLRNGLGAPLLESLQSGVWYPPNLWLFVLDTSRPGFFDWFSVAHVTVFLAGLYALGLLYGRRELALAVAVSVAFCGVTYQHMNMVHYRGAVWLPWMLWGAVRIARGRVNVWTLAGLAGAVICNATAGNTQDTVTSLIAMSGVFTVEWLARLSHTPSDIGTALWPRTSSAVVFSLVVGGGLAIGSLAILPYLVARGDGDLTTFVGTHRSIAAIDWDWMLCLLMPRIVGMGPHYLRDHGVGHWPSDFTTAGMLFVGLCAAAICIPSVPEHRRYASRAALAGLLLLLVTGLLKIKHVPLFDFFARIPFLGEVMFSKYHLWIYPVLGILGVAGLERTATMSPAARRRVVGITVAVGVLAGIAVGWRISHSEHWKSVWSAGFDPVVTRHLLQIYAVSLGTAVAAAALWCWRPERAGWALVALLVGQAALLCPQAYREERPAYVAFPSPFNPMPRGALESVNFTDPNWSRGVFRADASRAGFLVHGGTALLEIVEGTVLRFAGSGDREVVAVSGDQVWLAGGALDPETDGWPAIVRLVSRPKDFVSKYDPSARQRCLTNISANQNLFADVEEMSVFDPITNRRLNDFLSRHFEVAMPNVSLQPRNDRPPFTPRQVAALQWLGVSELWGYRAEPQPDCTQPASDVTRLARPVPLAFVISREDFDRLDSQWEHVPVEQSLADLHEAIAKRGLRIDASAGINRIELTGDKPVTGMLVLNQAYSGGWRINGRPARSFCNLLTAWELDAANATTTLVARYEPRGLASAWRLCCCGAVVIAGALAWTIWRNRTGGWAVASPQPVLFAEGTEGDGTEQVHQRQAPDIPGQRTDTRSAAPVGRRRAA